jgi:hypothetical protein
MRALLTIASLVLTTFVCQADVRTHIQNIRILISEQRQQLDDTKSRLDWTWTELQSAQLQITLVAKERDDWRDYGQDMYTRWMNDEVALAKYRKHGFFSAAVSVAGLVLSFVTNPFGFIVSKAIQVLFGVALVLIIFAVGFYLIRRWKRRQSQK